MCIDPLNLNLDRDIITQVPRCVLKRANRGSRISAQNGPGRRGEISAERKREASEPIRAPQEWQDWRVAGWVRQLLPWAWANQDNVFAWVWGHIQVRIEACLYQSRQRKCASARGRWLHENSGLSERLHTVRNRKNNEAWRIHPFPEPSHGSEQRCEWCKWWR